MKCTVDSARWQITARISNLVQNYGVNVILNLGSSTYGSAGTKSPRIPNGFKLIHKKMLDNAIKVIHTYALNLVFTMV